MNEIQLKRSLRTFRRMYRKRKKMNAIYYIRTGRRKKDEIIMEHLQEVIREKENKIFWMQEQRKLLNRIERQERKRKLKSRIRYWIKSAKKKRCRSCCVLCGYYELCRRERS